MSISIKAHDLPNLSRRRGHPVALACHRARLRLAPGYRHVVDRRLLTASPTPIHRLARTLGVDEGSAATVVATAVQRFVAHLAREGVVVEVGGGDQPGA